MIFVLVLLVVAVLMMVRRHLVVVVHRIPLVVRRRRRPGRRSGVVGIPRIAGVERHGDGRALVLMRGMVRRVLRRRVRVVQRMGRGGGRLVLLLRGRRRIRRLPLRVGGALPLVLRTRLHGGEGGDRRALVDRIRVRPRGGELGEGQRPRRWTGGGVTVGNTARLARVMEAVVRRERAAVGGVNERRLPVVLEAGRSSPDAYPPRPPPSSSSSRIRDADPAAVDDASRRIRLVMRKPPADDVGGGGNEAAHPHPPAKPRARLSLFFHCRSSHIILQRSGLSRRKLGHLYMTYPRIFSSIPSMRRNPHRLMRRVKESNRARWKCTPMTVSTNLVTSYMTRAVPSSFQPIMDE